MKKLVVIFVLSISNLCFAQTHYDNLKEADKQRALTNERNKERDRQNADNNRAFESKSSTNTTTSSVVQESYLDQQIREQQKAKEKASKELYNNQTDDVKQLQTIEWKIRNTYDGDELRKLYVELEYVKWKQEYANRNDKSYETFLKSKKKEEVRAADERSTLDIYSNKLKAVGYNNSESYDITMKYRSAILGKSYDSEENLKQFYNELYCLKAIKEGYSTAPFEVLKNGISELISKDAPVAALDCVELIESRFPDKKEALKDLKTDLVVRYFYLFRSQGDLSRMSELYFKLEDENPKIYNNFKAKSTDKIVTITPYKRLDNYYNTKLTCVGCRFEYGEWRNLKNAKKLNKEREEKIIKATKL